MTIERAYEVIRAEYNANRISPSSLRKPISIMLSQEPCDDAISREDAITAINKLYEECKEWRALNDLQYGKNQGLSLAIEVIDDLSPVTPKSETVTEFADRCRECGAKYGKLLKQKSWIPVSERLPEEQENPVTLDYYEYPVTYKNGDVCEVRYYKFGDGHWWHGFGKMDEYVTAWMPILKPYKAESEDKE